MHGYTRMLLTALGRRLFMACAVCASLLAALLLSMHTPVALGQAQGATAMRVATTSRLTTPVTSTIPAINQLYLPLLRTAPVQKQRIAQVDDVTVLVLNTEPPRLRITAYGMASSDGWRNPELVLRTTLTRPVSGISAFDFVAQPPVGAASPMLRPMSATYELVLAPLVSGVRIYALNNDRETPVQGIDQANVLLAPHQPHATDALQITVHGIWHDGCAPTYQSHQRHNQLITITTSSPTLADPTPVCGQAITPWNFTVAVGSLPAGAYTVTVGGAVTTTTTFSVTDEV